MIGFHALKTMMARSLWNLKTLKLEEKTSVRALPYASVRSIDIFFTGETSWQISARVWFCSCPCSYFLKLPVPKACYKHCSRTEPRALAYTWIDPLKYILSFVVLPHLSLRHSCDRSTAPCAYRDASQIAATQAASSWSRSVGGHVSDGPFFLGIPVRVRCALP